MMARASGRRLVADEGGATAIEYALLAALVAGAVIGAGATTGHTLGGLFGVANTGLVDRMEAKE
jgi:Flp pilus assembly pilin Flp